MASLREILGFDLSSKEKRRAHALVAADRKLLTDLIAVRKDQNLTQREVADRLGITQEAVSLFERYDNDPKLSTVRRYAHAVGALVAHAVEPDRGQLETSNHALIVTMTPVDPTTRVNAATEQRPVRMVPTDIALAA